jgi:flagellar hook-associated protein 3 FlgL
MPFRVTDAATNGALARQIAVSRQRLQQAQEQVASGKRINRPSDDPAGAEAVLNLRTTQATLEQFRRNAAAARDQLQSGDNALNQYQLLLDRARVILSQGASASTTQEGRNIIATEIDALRQQMLSLANQRSGELYVFGGTRQDAPPYDSATAAPASTPSTQTLIQIDPSAPPLATGVLAENVFADASGTAFDSLTAAATALRGTGDPAADRTAILTTIDRLNALADQAGVAQAQIGANLRAVENTEDHLGRNSLALEETVQRYESIDLAEAALKLTESERAVEAVLESAPHLVRRTLLDLLG